MATRHLLPTTAGRNVPHGTAFTRSATQGIVPFRNRLRSVGIMTNASEKPSIQLDSKLLDNSLTEIKLSTERAVTEIKLSTERAVTEIKLSTERAVTEIKLSTERAVSASKLNTERVVSQAAAKSDLMFQRLQYVIVFFALVCAASAAADSPLGYVRGMLLSMLPK